MTKTNCSFLFPYPMENNWKFLGLIFSFKYTRSDPVQSNWNFSQLIIFHFTHGIVLKCLNFFKILLVPKFRFKHGKPCAKLWHLKINYRNFITRNGLFSPTSNFGKLQWKKETFSASCALVCTGEGSVFRPFQNLRCPHKAEWKVPKIPKTGILPVLYGRFFMVRPSLPDVAGSARLGQTWFHQLVLTTGFHWGLF